MSTLENNLFTILTASNLTFLNYQQMTHVVSAIYPFVNGKIEEAYEKGVVDGVKALPMK